MENTGGQEFHTECEYKQKCKLITSPLQHVTGLELNIVKWSAKILNSEDCSWLGMIPANFENSHP